MNVMTPRHQAPRLEASGPLILLPVEGHVRACAARNFYVVACRSPTTGLMFITYYHVDNR